MSKGLNELHFNLVRLIQTTVQWESDCLIGLSVVIMVTPITPAMAEYAQWDLSELVLLVNMASCQYTYILLTKQQVCYGCEYDGNT